MFTALALAIIAAAGAADRHPQHDLTASSHDRTVRATLGSHCTRTNDAMMCADHIYPLPTKKRLPAHRRGRIVLRFGQDPVEVHATLRDGSSNVLRNVSVRGDGKRRTVRLPKSLDGTDRLGVFADYGAQESADFEVDLRRHRHG
ncbi:MAG TPA: hypothetical protein VD790_02960 [Thermoleophilaceae bacterium]|nr:hypothetical protein [Thermoleophilaceae bacterium]